MRREDVHISNPCPEDVELMEGEGKKAYCHKCEKNVHNLSTMTKEEARAFLDSRRGTDVCINYDVWDSGEIAFHQDGYPRPSAVQLNGVKKLLLAAMVPLLFIQPATLPATTALTAVYDSVGTQDGLTDVITKVIRAEAKMIEGLSRDFGFKTIEAKYAGNMPEVHPDEVTFN